MSAPHEHFDRSGTRSFVGTASGGGGSQPFLSVTRTLTPAELKDLTASPVVLVADPGAGFVVVPMLLTCSYVPGNTPYTDNGGAINVGQPGNSLFSAIGAGFWDSPDATINMQNELSTAGDPANFAGAVTAAGAGPGTDPTDGNGSVIVSVGYVIVPVTA